MKSFLALLMPQLGDSQQEGEISCQFAALFFWREDSIGSL